MANTFILLKRETSKSLSTAPHLPTAFQGFLLKVTVSQVNNITPKIFVMQRDVASNYVDGVLDTFYSVVSVGELEFIPEDEPEEDGTNFFRTDNIELMFETAAELEEGWEKIKYDVAALTAANDSSLEIESTLWQPIPSDAIKKYHGVSTSIISTGSGITGSLYSDDVFSPDIFFNITISVDSYVYVALPVMLEGNYQIKLNDVFVPTTSTVVSVTNDKGITMDYNLFRTTEKVSAPYSAAVSLGL